jgi:membrane-associated phospholipid phosphatase
MAVILLTFKALYFVIFPLHGRDYDDLLIAIDRWIFGVDPTVWIARFAHPLLTEILQIAYASFYFLFVIMGIELYRNGRMKDFLFFVFLILYGFYLSYVGYFFLPAVGPRFTLHDFYSTDAELPGLLFAKVLRDFVNIGESIPTDVSNPAAFTQRDVFPSGHTMMTLVMIYFVWRFRLKTKVFITVVGSLLIVATVYLRYHYVIDLAAGALFAALCIWSAPRVYRWWERLKAA